MLYFETVFTLFIKKITDYLDRGITVTCVSVELLEFANDIIFVDTNKFALKIMINSLNEHCEKWHLHVNLNKCKLLVFIKGGRSEAYKI